MARCFMLVLFLLVSGQLCSAPRYLSGHSNRNSTSIKHRAIFALLSPALLLYVWTRTNNLRFIQCSTNQFRASSAQWHIKIIWVQRHFSVILRRKTKKIVRILVVIRTFCSYAQLKCLLTLKFILFYHSSWINWWKWNLFRKRSSLLCFYHMKINEKV